MSSPTSINSPTFPTHTPQQLECTERDRQIVLSQLHNLILALRSNARFSSRMRFVQASNNGEHKLTLNVKELRERLFSPLADFGAICEDELLKPFMEVALSDETTEPITGVALAAFVSFLDLKCAFLSAAGLVKMSECAKNSRSEITDSQSHEAVLARILQVYVGCVKHPAAIHMSDQHVVEMMESAWRVATHGEPSELLRRTAEQAMNDMVAAVYERTAAGQGPCNVPLFYYLCNLICCKPQRTQVGLHQRSGSNVSVSGGATLNNNQVSGSPIGGTPLSADPTVVVSTPSSNTNRRVRVPQNISVAAVQLQGLCLAHTVLFILKEELLQPHCVELLDCVRNDLCRALLQVGVVSENIVVLSQLLRTLHLVVSFTSTVTVNQILSFLVAVHLSPMIQLGGSSPNEAAVKTPMSPNPVRSSVPQSPSTGTFPPTPLASPAAVDDFEARERHEMLMESILEFCSDHAFPTFAFTHYDLSLKHPMLLEVLCTFLSRNCLHVVSDPSNAGVSGTSPSTSSSVVGQNTSGPTGAIQLNQINVLSLDCLLGMLSTVAERVLRFMTTTDPDHNGSTSTSASKKAEELKAAHHGIVKKIAMKQRLLHFAEMFNQDSPKEGIQFIRTLPKDVNALSSPHGIADCFGVTPDCSGWDIGELLFKFRNFLDKGTLGRFIGELGKEPRKPTDDPDGSQLVQWEEQRRDDYKRLGTVRWFQHQLKGFINCFHFKNKPLLTSIREMVAYVGLPGESQQIDRMMEEFATQWFNHNKNGPPEIVPFETQDAVFVLSFAIIMVNTDQHSAKADKRITLDAFLAMTRGIDGGKSPPGEFVTNIYNDIKATEIVMVDVLQHGFLYDELWRMLVLENDAVTSPGGSSSPGQQADVNSIDGGIVSMRGSLDERLVIYDGYLFESLWRPSVGAFSTILDACGNSFAVGRSKTMEELRVHLDRTVPKLANIFQCALKGYAMCAQTANLLSYTPAIDHVVVSLLRSVSLPLRDGYSQLISFGKNPKSLLVCALLFKLILRHADSMRDSWNDVTALCHKMLLLGIFCENIGGIQELHAQLQSSAPGVESVPSSQQSQHIDPNKEPQQRRLSTSQNLKTSSSNIPVAKILLLNPGVALPPKVTDQNEGGWFSGLWGSPEAAMTRKREKDVEDYLALSRIRSASPSLEVLLQMSEALPDEAFVPLVQGFMSQGSIQNAAPFDAFTASYNVHLTVAFVVRNLKRLHLIEAPLFDYLERLLRTVFDGLAKTGDAAKGVGHQGGVSARQLHDHWKSITTRVVEALLHLVSRFARCPENHGAMLRLLSLTTSLHPQTFGVIVATPLSYTLFDIAVKSDFACENANTWDCLLTIAMNVAVMTQVIETRNRCLYVLVAVMFGGNFHLKNVPVLLDAVIRLMLAPPANVLEGSQYATSLEEEAWGLISQRHFEASGMVHSAGALSSELGGKTIPNLTKAEECVVQGIMEVHNKLMQASLSAALSSPFPEELKEWMNAWHCVLRALGTLFFTTHLNGKVSSDALLGFQRCVLDAKLNAVPSYFVYDLFFDIIFPLVERVCVSRQQDSSQAHGGAQGSSLANFVSSVFFGSTNAPSSSTTTSPTSKPSLPIKSPQDKQHAGVTDFSTPSRSGTGIVPQSPSSLPLCLPYLSDEMQCRTLSLLPKAFLHYMGSIMNDKSNMETLLTLWQRLFGILYALYSSRVASSAASGTTVNGDLALPTTPTAGGDASMVREAIQESVKNIIFVITSMLQIPENRKAMVAVYQNNAFWALTRQLLAPFDFSPALLNHLDTLPFTK